MSVPLPTALNLLNRDFSPEQPNQCWAGDVTFPRAPQGFVYLAVVIDLFSRYVVGWSVSALNDANLVQSALRAALARLSINDWRTGKPSWQVLVKLDQDGKFKSGAIDDRFITPDTGGPSAHDLKNARELVKAIGPQGVFPSGTALPQAKQPEFKGGHWFAPNGDRLLKVTVSRAFGGAPRPSVTAFVNPKKNDYYLEWDDPMGRTGNHFQGP